MNKAGGVLITAELLLSGLLVLISLFTYRKYLFFLRSYKGAFLSQRDNKKKEVQRFRKATKILSFLSLMPVAIGIRLIIPDPAGQFKIVPPMIMAAGWLLYGKKIIQFRTDTLAGTLPQDVFKKTFFSGFFFILMLLTLNFIFTGKEVHKELAEKIAIWMG